MNRRVVVTGLGATTPLGGDVPTTWRALLAGQSGVQRIEAEWVSTLPISIAASVAVDPSEVMDRIALRKLDRSEAFALIAAREAFADAGSPTIDPLRTAVTIASGIGGVTTLIEQYDIWRTKGARQVSPHTVPMLMPNGPAAHVGLEFGAGAGVHTPVSACASGAEAVAQGLSMIREGKADLVFAGGVEAAIHPLPLAAFASMKALSTRSDEPEKASRPYDRARDGFVLGEGGAVLILEEYESAKARSARIYGEVLGGGITSDGHHIAAPDPQGDGVVRAISMALADGNISTEDVLHINAHATSTPAGDIAEAHALTLALGSHLPNVLVSATKSMTGHLLGGAGAIESIFSVLALQERVAPPTINIDQLDPEISLNVVREKPRPLEGKRVVALNDSFGFGGHNVVVAFGSI
ncbi:MAG: beta-ketoacyl-ACP synthase II [Actinobacteria bacterium]|nr:beta-ketoacyl-ACP synthase II [Actinomycetota bacterium]